MQAFYPLLLQKALFAGFEENDMEILFKRLNAKATKFFQNETIIEQGDMADKIGIILEGQAFVVQDDAEGNRNIITQLSEGDLFLEVFATAGLLAVPVSVVAKQSGRLVFLDYAGLLDFEWQGKQLLHKNLLTILARKSLYLNQKNEILSKRDTRQKILEFMRQQSPPGEWFGITFSRQQLADYLCVERSAMTTVLSKLKREKKVDFEKNKFVWFLIK